MAKAQTTEELRSKLLELDSTGRWAFRGENAVFKTSTPTIGRLRVQYGDSPDVEEIRSQAYTVARWTHRVRNRFLQQTLVNRLGRVDPLSISWGDDEWFALLQHYGWLTHHLDLTLDPEMAIWFALEKHKRLGLAVLYAVDLDNLPGGIREVGHRKLAMQPYVELNCRWVVQSGVMLVPTEWPQMTAAEELNLRGLADSTSVRRFEFAPSPGDRAIIHGNPMNTESDWIAPLVRDVILFVAEGLKASHPVIRRHIEMIGEGAG